MKKIRVLVLSHMFPVHPEDYSGIFVWEHVRHLLNKGIDVRVVCPVPWSPRLLWFKKKWRDYGKTPHQSELGGVRIDYLRYLRPPGSWLYPWSGVPLAYTLKKLLWKLAPSFKPNLIHAHTLIPDGQAAMSAGAVHRIPVVCTARGGDINIYPYYNRAARIASCRVITGVDRLVTVSSDLAKKSLDLSPCINTRVIYNGVDTRLFSDSLNGRESARIKLGIKQDATVILFVGNLLKSKGVFELVEAFGRLEEKYGEKLILALVGEGPDRSEILARASRLGIIKKLLLAGIRPHEEIPEWLRSCDVFVLSSHNEGMPNAVLEAMSCARPVVATRVGGIPEVVENGKTGYLVEKEDTAGLREAMGRLLSDPERSKEMGRCGRETIVKRFSWDKNAEEHIRLYKDLIERREEGAYFE